MKLALVFCALLGAARAQTWADAFFPVEHATAYSSLFGMRTLNGVRAFHSGIDIAAPLGSAVVAWWAGRVSALGFDRQCGVFVRIDSGDYQHLYCHLAGGVVTRRDPPMLQDGELELQLGQEVTAGATIGRVGMSGFTTGPHLHWSVKYRGEVVDPARVLRQMVAPSLPAQGGY